MENTYYPYIPMVIAFSTFHVFHVFHIWNAFYASFWHLLPHFWREINEMDRLSHLFCCVFEKSSTFSSSYFLRQNDRLWQLCGNCHISDTIVSFMSHCGIYATTNTRNHYILCQENYFGIFSLFSLLLFSPMLSCFYERNKF